MFLPTANSTSSSWGVAQSDGILSLHDILPVLPVVYTQNTSNVRLPAQMHKNNLCQLLPMRRSSSLWALYSVLKGVVFTIHSFGLPFSPNLSSSSLWRTPRYSLALWDKQYIQCFLHLSLLQVKIPVYLHRDVWWRNLIRCLTSWTGLSMWRSKLLASS